MTDNELLEYICCRIAHSETADAIFSADEMAEWQANGVEVLSKAKLLRKAQPAIDIQCRGCEEYCMMPVNIIAAEHSRPARAFVMCDKRDAGRVAVDMERLTQWHAAGIFIAEILADLLGLSQAAIAVVGSRQWQVGLLHGKKHRGILSLLAEDVVALSLAGYFIPLPEVLFIKDGVLTLNQRGLLRLLDNPKGNTETPQQRRKRLKNRVNEERRKGNRAFLKCVAAEEDISSSRLKQILYG